MTSRTRRIGLAAVAAAVLGAGAVATVGLAAGTLGLRATGFSSFNTRQLTTKAGTVTLAMTNKNSIRHNIALRGPGITTVRGATVGTGGVSKVTKTLKRGTYTYFCGVPGHDKAGMHGTLKVT